MESKKNNVEIAPILIIVGGILSILAVFPGFDEYFPIVSGSFTTSGYLVHVYFTFWGVKETIPGIGSVSVNSLITGWGFLGFPPMFIFLIYVTIGIIAIIIGFNGIKKFIAKENIGTLPLTGLVGLILGLLNLALGLMIYMGDANSQSHFGLANLGSSDLSVQLGPFSIGLGYYLLLLSGIIILIGGIANLAKKQPVMVPNTGPYRELT